MQAKLHLAMGNDAAAEETYRQASELPTDSYEVLYGRYLEMNDSRKLPLKSTAASSGPTLETVAYERASFAYFYKLATCPRPESRSPRRSNWS